MSGNILFLKVAAEMNGKLNLDLVDPLDFTFKFHLGIGCL